MREDADDGPRRLLTGERATAKIHRRTQVEHQLHVPVGKHGRHGYARRITADVPERGDDLLQGPTGYPLVVADLHDGSVRRLLLFVPAATLGFDLRSDTAR